MKEYIGVEFDPEHFTTTLTDPQGRPYCLMNGDTLTINHATGQVILDRREDDALTAQFKQTGTLSAEEEKRVYARAFEEIVLIRNLPKRLEKALKGFARTLQRRKD